MPEDVEVRVWDSTAELRYLVLPERPLGGRSASRDQGMIRPGCMGIVAIVTIAAMTSSARADEPPTAAAKTTPYTVPFGAISGPPELPG